MKKGRARAVELKMRLGGSKIAYPLPLQWIKKINPGALDKERLIRSIKDELEKRSVLISIPGISGPRGIRMRTFLTVKERGALKRVKLPSIQVTFFKTA